MVGDDNAYVDALSTSDDKTTQLPLQIYSLLVICYLLETSFRLIAWISKN